MGGWVRQAANNALTGTSDAAWSSKPLQVSLAPHLNIMHAPVQRTAGLLCYSACLVRKTADRRRQVADTLGEFESRPVRSITKTGCCALNGLD